MSADDLLQFVTQALFILIFLAVTVKAAREPRRAAVDTALLFGDSSLLIAVGWAAAALRIRPNGALLAVIDTLLMALPYLLVRLVDDFADVPRPVRLCAALGLGGAALSFFFLPQSVVMRLALLYVVYFGGLTLYVAVAFIRAARQSGGVTRRRMQAVAFGSICLGLTIVMAGIQAGLPALAPWWIVLGHLFALGSGLGYFIGFAPPAWLRRAWQEPDVRAFLGRAARLPRLPETRAIVQELEHGAATSLGAPHAVISLWDETAGVLRGEMDGAPFVQKAHQMFGGRAFTAQRPIFSSNTLRDDPANAAIYQERNARAVLAIPITAGDKRLGVLIVYAARASIFAEDDLVLAQLLADQAAVILESRALIDEAARVQAREESARLKDDFLSAAAHDLKTPLTTLLGHAQLLERRARRDPSAPADLHGITHIVSGAQRLKRLVFDLLDVARVEQGKLVGNREPVNLVALLEDACARHASAVHRCLLESEGPVIGAYDSTRMMQLVENLLENAIKYSPEGGAVRVKVWREDDQAVFTVSDTGIGIGSSDLPHLFDRFQRGANADTRHFAGMGLGLFICRSIVEQHGGRLWATSPGLGQGSTFHVVLPITPQAATPAPGNREQDVPRSPVRLVAEADAPLIAEAHEQ